MGNKKTCECCKDCVAPKRHIGCHAICPEYIKWREEKDSFNKKMLDIKELRNLHGDMIHDSIERMKRGKRRSR